MSKMKAVMLSMASVFLTGGVVTNAFYQKKQFYPSVVYLTKSSPSMAILYLQAFVLVVLAGKLMRKVFFGQLRPAEVEHLIERSWYAVTETCLAFTVFREDFSPRFVALFTLLLFLKCFHWLAEDRIDYMERSPLISWIFHIRAVSLLTMLGLLDVFFVCNALNITREKGASVQLVFGFEYAILLMNVIHVFMKYVLHTIDLQNENPWENKAVYLLHTELVLGFCRVVLYILFLGIMIRVHTFPLFIIRPMYLTLREFKKSLNDVVMSRRAIRNMNTLYPDATPEELASGDNVCIICREEMHTSCKKLPCNHIFHVACLRSWFQRQQTCPTCRMDVLRATQPAAPAQPIPQQPLVPPPGFPPMFPMWPPNFAPVPPVPPPQPPATTAATTQATAPQTTSAGAQPGPVPPSVQQPFSQLGFVPPPTTQMPGFPTFASDASNPFPAPPMFMPPPFLAPMFGDPFPPPMSPNFTGLTDEELRRMEGVERENVEARIMCLRDIQVLLDASMLYIQQYFTAFGDSRNIGINPTQAFRTSSEMTPSSSVSLSTVTHPTSVLTGSVNTSKPSTPTPNNINTASSSVEAQDKEELEGAVGYTPPEDVAKWVDEPTESDDTKVDEVRRRRVQRFSLENSDESSESTKPK